MHLANLYGEDKVSFDDRVAFVEANMDKVGAASEASQCMATLASSSLVFGNEENVIQEV